MIGRKFCDGQCPLGSAGEKKEDGLYLRNPPLDGGKNRRDGSWSWNKRLRMNQTKGNRRRKWERTRMENREGHTRRWIESRERKKVHSTVRRWSDTASMKRSSAWTHPLHKDLKYENEICDEAKRNEKDRKKPPFFLLWKKNAFFITYFFHFLLVV